MFPKQLSILVTTFILQIAFVGSSYAQTPSIEWQRCIGGSDGEAAFSIIQTNDSGYAVIGLGSSNDGDGLGTHGLGDYFLVKLNQFGAIEWKSIYGGSEQDRPAMIFEREEGGFIIVGTTLSIDGDVIFNHGYYDIWIVSISDIGEIEWQQSLGGSSIDIAYSVQQTSDGGFIVVGSSESLGDDVSNHHGPVGFEPDFWVVKLNTVGEIEWEHSYGGLEAEEATSVIQMSDNGYVVVGYTTSNDGDVSGLHGMAGYYSDFWVIRIDSIGNLLWQKCLGGTGNEIAFALTKSNTEECLITGIAHSSDGDVTWEHPGDELWVVQLESTGEIDWEQTYGGENDDRGYGIIKNSDSDYFIIGTTTSYDEVTNWHGYIDYWLLNIDSGGSIISENCYGGSDQEGSSYYEDFADIKKTMDNGYIFAGYTESNDGDVSGLHDLPETGGDYWVVKLCNPENESWYYLDADSDGFGNSEIALKSCVTQEAYVTDSTDCNDANPDIHPGTAEVLNGLDDDCDGQSDEGLSIINNQVIQVSIHPIPATDHIIIDYPASTPTTLNLYTSSGAIIYNNPYWTGEAIDISNFPPAMYYLQLLQLEKVGYGCFVKE